jgi:hypothetical protein
MYFRGFSLKILKKEAEKGAFPGTKLKTTRKMVQSRHVSYRRKFLICEEEGFETDWGYLFSQLDGMRKFSALSLKA